MDDARKPCQACEDAAKAVEAINVPGDPYAPYLIRAAREIRENCRHAQPAASAEDVREACAKVCERNTREATTMHATQAHRLDVYDIRALDLSKINAAPQDDKHRPEYIPGDVVNPAGASPLTVYDIEAFRQRVKDCVDETAWEWLVHDVDSVCDVALRSIAPGFVSVPRDLVSEILTCMCACEEFDHHGNCQSHYVQPANDCWVKKLSMLAAAGEGKP